MGRVIRTRSLQRRGFTLIEASLVIVIIGVAVTAMLELLATGTASNSDATSRTTALTIARAARERALTQTYAQVIALNGSSYSPPIDGRGERLEELPDWQQTIQVQPVNAANILTTTSGSNPAAVRVTVHAFRGGKRMATLNWYQFNPS
jgi:prepilin-type N-terminal cleavage/methylation domain-containing protein